MGKRSGVPHRDEELTQMNREQLEAELARAHFRLRIAPSAKVAKHMKKHIHWLETELERRSS